MDEFSCLISISPIIGSSYSAFSNEEVFGVVDVLVGPRLDPIDDLANGGLEPVDPSMPQGVRTRGSKSIKIARGMYLVSSDW